MRKLACLLLFSFTGISGVLAQSTPDSTNKAALISRPEVAGRDLPKRKTAKNYSKFARAQRANKQIQSLKNGVLLVRLRTSEIAINNLKKSGNEKMAATLQNRQDAANKRLIAAFKKQFTFCPVYFFYSSDTEKVKAGSTAGYFLNENLQEDRQLALPDTNFFVAEVTELEQFREDPDSPQASINAEVSFKALVLRDKRFHQLTKPFPFFIKAASNFPPRKRSEGEMVSLLNTRLEAYYKNSGERIRNR